MDILQHLGPSLNVAYCYGAFEEHRCVGIVMELLTGGELFSRIRTGCYSEKGEASDRRRSSRAFAPATVQKQQFAPTEHFWGQDCCLPVFAPAAAQKWLRSLNRAAAPQQVLLG